VLVKAFPLERLPRVSRGEDAQHWAEDLCAHHLMLAHRLGQLEHRRTDPPTRAIRHPRAAVEEQLRAARDRGVDHRDDLVAR